MSAQDTAFARQWYDRLSGVYDRLSDFSERPARLRGLRLFDPRPNERLLEIGFGTGHAIVALAHAVGPQGKVIGIELSEKMTALTQERVQEESLDDRVELRVADAKTLDLPAHSVDGVFISFALELFAENEIMELLGRVRRTLRPNGRLCIVGLTEAPRPALGTRIYKRLHAWFPKHIDCQPIEAERMVQQAGYRIEACESFSLWGIPGRVLLAKVA